MSNTWIIGDTHFGHPNILIHCARPFSTVQQMDEALTSNWNSVVKPEDLVWHLGDFTAFVKDLARIEAYRKALNGRIRLIRGNHDWGNASRYIKLGFEESYRSTVYDRFVLSHYPGGPWVTDEVIVDEKHPNGRPKFNKGHKLTARVLEQSNARGVMHGHVHNSRQEEYPDCLNVSADVLGFTPIPWEEAKVRWDEARKREIGNGT